MKTIVILGAGTGGTIMANRLARRLSPKDWRILVVDRDRSHVYQPGLLFVPFGAMSPGEVVRDRALFLPPEVELLLAPIAAIEPDRSALVLEDGRRITYDFLIVATGTRLAPESTSGLTGPGWHHNAFDFYTVEGATRLARALARLESGRVVVHITELPIKCPVAPLEMAFLLDAHLTETGRRRHVDLVYATPLDGAFTKPRASMLLGDMLDRRRIGVEANFSVEAVDTEDRKLIAYDGRQLDYDLLITIPRHTGAELVSRSGMGDESGFIPTDPRTLQCKVARNVFALGDAADLPTSKAGSSAHFQSEVLVENLLAAIDERPPPARYDGHANCFIETGFDRAMLIDFNYDTEPLPGRFPLPGVGPFALLAESHANHWGKLAFRFVYWNLLLKGAELPIDHAMSMAGKWGAS